MIKNILKIGMLLVLAISITNCQGEDGSDGADGADGADGVNGVDGTNGEDGTDGVNGADNTNGFDDAVAYGSISIALDGSIGEDEDNEPFTNTTDFIYTDLTVPMFTFTNSFYEDENTTEFSIGRSVAIPVASNFGFSRSEAESGFPPFLLSDVYIYLEVEDLGLETEVVKYLEVYMNDYNVINDDLQSFIFSGSFEYVDESEELKGAGGPPLLTDTEISDINFNSETNELSFSFTATLPEEANSTGNEVTVSTTVDVIVVKSLDDIF